MSFVIWGYADPATIETDDIVGDWVSTLYPDSEVGFYFLGDYQTYISWSPSIASADFTIAAP